VAAQALLVREAMAAMGGSEAAWGVVMALWLAGVAGGTRCGVRFGSLALAMWLPTIAMILTGVGVFALRTAPAAIGVVPGETVTAASAVWLWILAIVPAAAAGGMAFPILAEKLGPSGGGRAYGFEALGALAGGVLLSVGLIHLGAASALCLGLGVVAVGAAWQRRSVVAAVVALMSFTLSMQAGGFLARVQWKASNRPGTLSSSMETRYQQIMVSDGPPISIYGDGRLLATYPDPWSVLPKAHVLMLLHPAPRHVFAVGCVVNGAVEAMAAHPVDRLTVVEEDPDLLRALPSFYGSKMKAALKRPSVRAVATDPLRAVTERDDWDLVLLLDGDPLTLRRNRTRTLEFFRTCRSHMRPDGVLVLRVGVADTYLGGAGGRLLSIIASTLREVFEQLVLIPGSETLMVAGSPEADITIDAAELSTRFEKREVNGPGFQPEMIPVLVDATRARELTDGLRAGGPMNTIRHPRAVLVTNALHEARVLPDLLAVVSAVNRAPVWVFAAALSAAVAVLFIAAAGRYAPLVIAGTVGFSSMGWWLILIASWQSTRGSVYSEIGALTAAFMAGVGAGSLVCSGWSRPERRLPAVLVAGTVVSIAIACGLAVAAPAVAVPALLGSGGLLTGAAFPGLARMAGRTTRLDSGEAFAADEAGAAAAAVTIGVFIIPWVGLTWAAAGLAVLQAAAIPAALSRIRHG
jgi:spermidine synthase